MNSTPVIELALPVRGMSCAGCAAHVEQAIQQLPGVSRVVVNLAAGQAHIEYDPGRVDLVEFQRAVLDAGYTIPTREVALDIQGMSCMSCVSHVQGALEDLPGVLDAPVNLSKGVAQVTYVPELVSTAQMEQAVQEAGYRARVSETSGRKDSPTPEQTQDEPVEQNEAGFIWRFKNLLRRS